MTGDSGLNSGRKETEFLTVQYFKVPNEAFFDQNLHEQEFMYRMFALDGYATKRSDEIWLLTLKA